MNTINSQTGSTRCPVRGDLSDDGSAFYDGAEWGWQPLWLHRDAVLPVCRQQLRIDASDAQLLSGGFLNQNWRLRCDDHDRVLRVGRAERTVEQVAYEYTLTSAWAAEIDQIVLAERPPGPSIDGHLLTVFPYREGISGAQVPAPRRTVELAPVLAAMHRIALELDLGQRPGFPLLGVGAAPVGNDHRSPVGARWHAVRSAVLDRYGTGPEVLTPATVVDRAVDELTVQLERWHGQGRLDRRAPVHADLNVRNQLYRDHRLVGIIDADDCRVEPLISEVAGLAYADPAVDPAAAWQLYRQAGGPLPDEDQELLLPFARLGCLGELEWFTADDGTATHLALGKLQTLADQLAGGPIRD
ncbi:phosphotransferase enzyme family protein [Microlunatus soli]|uniref:Ser/Thr protein kinase RdoA involved in Cpx stress response, MazF antagonist n=1 Tax=Microlunatus soli TaxID=630515 RepID=A0A1H2ABW3_9ACTN|nr:phosphotransferase [Microlunatus soli]SDT43242.1 Ser/Thr protein kinase RdoA involved in Cpx stress response, MazF antagonist [Microlunatus soli]